MRKLVLPRRKLITAAIAAPFVFNTKRAEAFLPHGGGGSNVAPPNALTQLLATMNVGQWKRISGPEGNLFNYRTAYNQSNFDGYAATGYGAVSSGAYLGASSIGSLCSAFSGGAIDPVNLVVLFSGGGHSSNSRDSTFYRFDILKAANIINNNLGDPGAAWSNGGSGANAGLPGVGAQTATYTPNTDPRPAGSHDPLNTYLVSYSGTVSGVAGQKTVTINSWNMMGHQFWQTGGYISHQPTGQLSTLPYPFGPGLIPAGTYVTNSTQGQGFIVPQVGDTLTLSNALVFDLNAALVVSSPSIPFGWATTSRINGQPGQSMMQAVHTYQAMVWVPGTKLCLVGGKFSASQGNSGGGWIYDDSKPDGQNVTFTSESFLSGYYDNCGGPVFCPGDVDAFGNPNGPVLLWNARQSGYKIWKFPRPFPGGGNGWSLQTGAQVVPYDTEDGAYVTCYPDPGAPGKWCLFGHHDPTLFGSSSGGFYIVSNVSTGGGNVPTYTGVVGTYVNNPGTLLGSHTNNGVCWNPDLGGNGMPVVFNATPANGQLAGIDINSSYQATVRPLFTSPSGDFPHLNSMPAFAYSSVYKCYIALTLGDVFICRAA